MADYHHRVCYSAVRQVNLAALLNHTFDRKNIVTFTNDFFFLIKGCGKTLHAKAVANEAGINFIYYHSPKLLDMNIGERDSAIRECFQLARKSAPCVLFFDEIEALCQKRPDHYEGYATQLLKEEMAKRDGVEERKAVFLMGASNRPDLINRSVLRSDVLGKTLYVGLPSQRDRIEILRAITKVTACVYMFSKNLNDELLI